MKRSPVAYSSPVSRLSGGEVMEKKRQFNRGDSVAEVTIRAPVEQTLGGKMGGMHGYAHAW